jgi:predicted acyltransferase
VLPRAVLLYLLGIFYYGGFANPPGVRFMGVLQRIALCYLFTGLAVINLRVRGIIILLVVLLVGYWAWLSFVPLPGAQAISFAAEKNWTNYLDAHYLPGWKWESKTWDPEGLLSTLPAIGTCLLGALAAELLRSRNISEWRKVGCLIGGGIMCVLAGYWWGHHFPIIKKLWTSSFVLVAGGYSCILMGTFYAVIDIWKLRRWAIVFLWIGSNAITLYMAESLLNFERLAGRMVGGDVQAAIGRHWGGTGETPGGAIGMLLLNGVALALMLVLARFLYQRKIFLRL